jgi:uncharacterized protein (DUF305 family)
MKEGSSEMKRLLLIGLVAAVCSCRKEAQPVTTAPPASDTPVTTASAESSAAAAPYDLQFIDTMSKHHQAAVDMAGMAKDKVQLPELKALTKKIPADQKKEIDEMKSWRQQWYPAAPSAENMDMPGMKSSMSMDMSHLGSMKPGRDYDAMFIDMMVPHHEGAVQMSQDALNRAQHPEIKALAQRIIDAQTREIAGMNSWKAKLAVKEK